jgi:hypothetical protein
MHYRQIPAERQGQLIWRFGKRGTADPSLARELIERLGGARK